MLIVFVSCSIIDLLSKVLFEKSRGKVYITNASQITLANVQTQMQGEAEKAGFQTEDDVVAYIKELRKAKREFLLIQIS